MSERVIDELLVLRTVFDFTASFDNVDLDGMLSRFAPDGCWHRQAGDVNGHDGVRKLMAERPPGLFGRHILTNSRVDFTSQDEARCASYLMVFRLDLPDKPQGFPIEFDGRPRLVGQCADRLVRLGGQWKLAERRATIELQRHSRPAGEGEPFR